MYLSTIWSRVNTEYSIHWVLHTLHTAYTEYCIHRMLHPPKIDCLTLPASLISPQTMLYSILYIPIITSEPMNRVSAPATPPSRTTVSRLITPKYLYLALLLPPSAFPNSLNHSRQVWAVMASKCISRICSVTISASISMFSLSRPPCASPNMLDYCLQVRLQTCSIAISECIFKWNGWLPACVCPNTLDYRLQVHLQTRTITACKLAQSPPPSASPNSPAHSLCIYDEGARAGARRYRGNGDAQSDGEYIFGRPRSR